MSSYAGFLIWLTWMVLLAFLIMISGSLKVLTVGVPTALIILILAALLDARIDQLNNTGGINND